MFYGTFLMSHGSGDHRIIPWPGTLSCPLCFFMGLQNGLRKVV
jgi:hypothetical protein